MSFELVWTKRFKKDLKLIEKSIASRIYYKLIELEKSDEVFLEEVKGTDFSKFRIGDYRVFIKKMPALKKLFVLRVGHRKNIYKKI